MTGVKRQSTSLAAILVDRGTGGPGERGLIQKWFRLITRRAELEGLQGLSGSRHPRLSPSRPAHTSVFFYAPLSLDFSRR